MAATAAEKRGWRAQGDNLGLDEFVADGGDIHLERLDTRSWYLCLGGQARGTVRLWFTFRRDGSVAFCNSEITERDGKSYREETLVPARKRRGSR